MKTTSEMRDKAKRDIERRERIQRQALHIFLYKILALERKQKTTFVCIF
jgi:hypothetical protein